jgi:hypothetical protein
MLLIASEPLADVTPSASTARSLTNAGGVETALKVKAVEVLAIPAVKAVGETLLTDS